MAQFWGYHDANIVSVTTQDGYILEMHHIPYGRNRKCISKFISKFNGARRAPY